MLNPTAMPIAAAQLVVLCLAWHGPAVAQPSEEVAYGAEDYARFCAQCHGRSGKGDGPMASHLITRPADLTGLTARNDGRFPEVAAYNIIDNGGKIDEHGTENEPKWGEIFAAEPSPLPAEVAADTRIHDLMDFLKSIQEK